MSAFLYFGIILASFVIKNASGCCFNRIIGLNCVLFKTAIPTNYASTILQPKEMIGEKKDVSVRAAVLPYKSFLSSDSYTSIGGIQGWIRQQYSLDYGKAWSNQGLSENAKKQFEVWGKEVNDRMISYSGGRQLSEFSKIDSCVRAIDSMTLSPLKYKASEIIVKPQ